jgi:hypothetical protein
VPLACNRVQSLQASPGKPRRHARKLVRGSDISASSADQSEIPNVLQAIWLRRRRGSEALLGQVGPLVNLDGLEQLSLDVVEDSEKEFVSEVG